MPDDDDDDPPPLPVLGYTRPAAFGWREDGDELVLVLPPGPRWELLADRGRSLLAATTFMLMICGLVVVAARSAGRDATAELHVSMTAFGLLAIGIWVLVVMRFVAEARTPPAVARVRVSPLDGLSVEDAPGRAEVGPWCSPPGEVTDVRLMLVRRRDGQLRHARLQVAGRGGTVVAFALPWPPDVPPGPYEARLRETLGLSSRAGDVRAAR